MTLVSLAYTPSVDIWHHAIYGMYEGIVFLCANANANVVR